MTHEGICVGHITEAGAVVFNDNHRGFAIRLRLYLDVAFGGKGSFIPCVLNQFFHEIPRLAANVEFPHS